MSKDVDIFVQGLLRYDPAVAERAQERSVEMLALLLIVGSAARFEIGPIEASAVAPEVRERIWRVLEACAPEVSLWKVERLAQRFQVVSAHSKDFKDYRQ